MDRGMLRRCGVLVVVLMLSSTTFLGLMSMSKALSIEAALLEESSEGIIEDTVRPISVPSTDYDSYSLNQAYMEKISRNLLDIIQTDPYQQVKVVIYTGDPVALGQILRANDVQTAIGTISSTLKGIRPLIVEIPTSMVPKVAYIDSVEAITNFELPSPLKINNHQTPAPRKSESGSANNLSLYSATKGHHVDDAWASGYTGSGVRIAVMDSGVDFAHPDLLWTWAIEENTSSPYFGWPMAFDPYSMYTYMIMGSSYPTVDESWYVDTSFNVTADANFLLPAFNGRQYNVSGVSSASGYYHLGLHPAPTLNFRYGNSPGILVVDNATAYSYDTIFVDLNDNGRFDDDKPANMSSPVSYADYRNASDGTYNTSIWNWGDGMPDISGGLLYFISDGVRSVPYADVIAFRYGIPNQVPGNGNLVTLMIGDQDVIGGDHGTLCASAMVAQNMTGNAQGFAPDAKVISVGNVYNGGFLQDIYLFAIEGYDGIPDTGDEAMIASVSFSYPSTVNDGWDYESRWIDFLSSFFQGTTFVIATGNGGPGFGTTVSPSGSSSISVGSSTNYYNGSKTFWEDGSIWNFGDVQPSSNRGPSALGKLAPHVVTVGTWSSGDNAINRGTVGETNGTDSWSVWGGTDLASSATSGILALLYDAYYQSKSVYPTAQQVRRFLMNGASDIDYDPLIMGSGLTNANRSAMIAAQKDGVLITPSMWTPGSYRGTSYSSFANIIPQGGFSSVTFQVKNQNATKTVWVNITDMIFNKTGELSINFWSNISDESPSNQTRPDYLWNVGSMIPANTSFVRVVVYTNYSSFDPEMDYLANNGYTVLFYNWDDINNNGVYWNDTNGNGVVNSGEMDAANGTEIMRFTYADNTANIVEALIHDPLNRIASGLLLGVQHSQKDAALPSTLVHVVLEFYETVDFSWITENKNQFNLVGNGQDSFIATINVPVNSDVGVYSAMIKVNTDGVDTVIPIIVNVAGGSSDIDFIADSGNTRYYDNGRINGGFDWSSTEECGDWRFYFMDVPDSTPISNGTRLLVHTQWTNVPTDIDTHVLGPVPDSFSAMRPTVFGPYTLNSMASSTNTNMGGGVWRFNTVANNSEEWVAAPIKTGLHEIALHNVLFSGEGISEIFSGGTGLVSAGPSPWSEQIPLSFGSKTFTFRSTMDIPIGIDIKAYGTSQPTIYSSLITQNERISYFVNTTDAGLMDLLLTSSYSVDIDLYLYYVIPGVGETLVSSSTSPTADERVKLTMPVNGTYRIEVYGALVPLPDVTFELTVDIREGNDMVPTGAPSGPIIADLTYQFQIQYVLPDIEGDYLGVIFISLKGAAPMIEIPVLLIARDVTPPTINLQTPSPGVTYKSTNVPVISASFDDVHGAFYSGIDVSRVRIIIDGRDVTSSASVVPSHLWWNMTFLLGDGQHTVDLQVRDRAMTPNQVMMFFSFSIDNIAPTIVITSPTAILTNQPLIDVAGYTDPDVTMVFINGIPTSTSAGAFSRTIILNEGLNTIIVEATDPVGNTAKVTKMITLDTIPPNLIVTYPTPDLLLNESSIVVSGITEKEASVSVNGITLTVDSNGGFSARIALFEGLNNLTFIAKDVAGNFASPIYVEVTVDTIIPQLTLTAPTEMYSRNTTVNVTGITEIGVQLAVNGNLVSVAGDGTFSTALTFSGDGPKTIQAVATDAANNEASVTKTIVLDTTPPALMVTRPPPIAPLEVSLPAVEVTGITEIDATITVSGQIAIVQPDGSFDIVIGLLLEGLNTITITATDPAGNTNSVQRTVIYNPPNIQDMQDNISQLQSEIQNLTALLDQLHDQLNDTNDIISLLEDRLNRLNQNLTRNQEELTAARADVDSLSNVLLMSITLLIAMLFVGLFGIYFALGKKIDSLRGPRSDFEEFEEEIEEEEDKLKEEILPEEKLEDEEDLV